MRSKFKWIFTLLVALTMQFSFAQEKTISGIVSDATGSLPGANVVVKGTTRGTQTDVDGKYTISAKAGDVLVISYVGMADKTVSVGAASTYNVKLAAGQELDTVVVGAMGIKRTQNSLTSPNQVVRTKELTQAANPNVIQSLAGKVSGLQINTISNGVNPDTKIVLRGNRSISGSNVALIVIDGTISSATILSQLPPEIVESVNVIKGAQGAALYGSQGVNGVIIVTTKRGNGDSKVAVSINSSVDFENVAFLPTRQSAYGQGWADDQGFSFAAGDPRNGQNYVPFENGAWGPAFTNPAFIAGGQVPQGLPQADGSFFLTDFKSLGDNNIKGFFQTGNLYQNGFTLNAGDQDSYILLNAKRQTNEFVVGGDKLKRSSFILNAGKKFNKFSIDGNITYIGQSTTQTDGGLFDDLLQAATDIDVTRFKNSAHQSNWTVYAYNPYRLSESIRNNSKVNNFNGVLRLGLEFTKNISANLTSSAQLRNSNNDQHNDGVNIGNAPINFGSVYTYGGNATSTYADLGGQAEASSFYVSQSIRRNLYNDFLVNFDYDLGYKVGFKLNVGVNIQDDYFRSIRQGGTNLDVPGFYNITNVLNPDLQTGATLKPFNIIENVRRFAEFANLDLAYDDFAFLNATFRNEEASNIPGKNYVYSSAGISFLPTLAFKSIKGKVLNYAKFTASIVRNGNATPVPTYSINDTARPSAGFPFGDLVAFQINRNPTDPATSPEFVTTKEISGNLGFFNDRITLGGSYYVADTKDLITNVTTSTPSGLSTKLGNIGGLRNKGYEIDLGLTPIKTENFEWNMNGSYTTYKTVVTALAPGSTQVNLQSNTFIGVFAEVGEEFPLIKGTKYIRDNNGSIVVNANGLPLRTSTFEKLGKSNPDYIVNFSNTFKYKGIQLTAVMDYRTGHQIFSEQVPRLAAFGYLEQSAGFDRDQPYVVPNSVQIVGGVSVPNTTMVNNNATDPRPYSRLLNYFSGNYDRTGEALILDATAFKVREIALSYTIPSKFLKNTGVESFKFGVNARNPFVKLSDSNKGYVDPESSNTAGNGTGLAEIGQYPTTKTYGFSLNLTF